MQCRAGCGACCIAPSISSPIPGMPAGKPAGIRCIQLDSDNFCLLFDSALRPKVCSLLQPAQDMCGSNNEEAFSLIKKLEKLTDS